MAHHTIIFLHLKFLLALQLEAQLFVIALKGETSIENKPTFCQDTFTICGY